MVLQRKTSSTTTSMHWNSRVARPLENWNKMVAFFQPLENWTDPYHWNSKWLDIPAPIVFVAQQPLYLCSMINTFELQKLHSKSLDRTSLLQNFFSFNKRTNFQMRLPWSSRLYFVRECCTKHEGLAFTLARHRDVLLQSLNVGHEAHVQHPAIKRLHCNKTVCQPQV